MAFASGTLYQQIVRTTQTALASGALQPIATQMQSVQDGDIDFCVRIIDSLARKEAVQKTRSTTPEGKPFNPFLPYEEALCVGQLSDTHVCLLNEFKVVDHHILIVTRHYESQDSWLTLADFMALTQCLLEIDGLGFYNGGQQAGASQHHKHLQVVPVADSQGLQALPIDLVIKAYRTRLMAADDRLPNLPFQHRVQLLALQWQAEQHEAIAQTLWQTYRDLLVRLGVSLEQPQPALPYNLLLTRDWMMVVARSQEAYQGIGVNSLGYAGCLLVKTLEDLDRLRAIGPLNLLQSTGHPIKHP